MNSVELIGRTTRELEVKYAAQSQMAVLRFTLAVNRPGKDKGADFISCVAFGKTAENLEKYSAKGLRIALQGHIQTGSYKDKNGNTVYTTDIVADRVEIIDWKEKQATSDRNGQLEEMPDSFQAIDEDIPF